MSDIPFFGKPVGSFREAYPQIGDFEIRVEQDLFGHYVSNDARRVNVYTPASPPPPVIRCVNPQCQQGGLDLKAFFITADAGSVVDLDETFYCRGHEGSPKGRRVGNPCDNAFKVKMRIAPRTG